MPAEQMTEPEAFFCNISSFMATKNYQREGRCVRLIGVAPEEFTADALSSDKGVATYTFDIGFWDYLRVARGLDRWQARTHASGIESMEENSSSEKVWLRLELRRVGKGEKSHGYSYRTFSDEEITVPDFFKLVSLTPVSPPTGIKKFTTPHNPVTNPFSPGGLAKNTSDPYSLYTYHVGQGMCSLVANSKYGILLDAGAGKPVLKPIYQTGAMINELRNRLDPLEDLNIYVSHADRDHWSLLEWDPAIRAKVRSIFIPEGYRTLEMTDKAVIHKIFEIKDAIVPLDPKSVLKLWRSKPAESDNNGECLVAVFEHHGEQALIPGDYVYSRMNLDGHTAINTLRYGSFKAVVVPHHGDEASALDIFSPASGAVAFFSAGTHQRFKHPRKVSKAGHHSKGYRRVVRNRLRHMIEVKLL